MQPPPELAERYEILGLLGRGGMGSVYRARDRNLGRDVALKLVQQSASNAVRRKRFEREGQVTANLRHPGIVQVHSAGLAGGQPYLAYELVEGARTLDEAVADLDVQARVSLVRDAARALGHAHRHGVVHRDVKPANLLVDRAGRLRVADFGLAAAQGLERLTLTGAIVGTPSYLAPEQATGVTPTPATDVWALGVVLYEALSGELPFHADTLVELIAQITSREPVPLREHVPGIPTALERICARALNRKPEARFADGEELAEALDACLRGEPATSSRTLAWAAGAAALALAALVLFYLGSRPGGVNASAPEPRAGPVVAPHPSPEPEPAPEPEPTVPTPRLSDGPARLIHQRTLRAPIGNGRVCARFLGDDVVYGDGRHGGPFYVFLIHRGGELLGTWGAPQSTLGLATIGQEKVFIPIPEHRPIILDTKSGEKTELELERVDRGVACVVPLGTGGYAFAYPAKTAIVLGALAANGRTVTSHSSLPWPKDTPAYALDLDRTASTLVAVGGSESSDRGLVAVWSTETGERLAYQRLTPTYALDLHPTQPLFVVGTRSSQIHEFPLDGRGELEPTPRAFVDDSLEGTAFMRKQAHAGYVAALAYSPDGRHLFSTGASSSAPNINDVVVWRLADGKLLERYELDRVPNSMALSADGRYLVVGTKGGKVELFKTTDR